MTRPQVVVIQVASVDGRLAPAPGVLSMEGDERFNLFMTDSGVVGTLIAQLQPHATLEGSSSFVRESDTPPALPPVEGDATALYEDFLPEEVLNRPGHVGWFTVVDGRGRVRLYYTGAPGKEYPGMEGWHALFWVGEHTPPEYLAYLRREKLPYLVAGSGSVDLALALQKMKDKLGVERMLSSAGGRLNGALLRARLVDEINVELVPMVVGGTDTPALFSGPALQPDEWPTRLRLLSTQSFANGSVWLRYEVLDAMR